MSPDDSFEIKKEGDFIHLKDEEDEYLIQTESEEDEMEMDGMTTMEGFTGANTNYGESSVYSLTNNNRLI
jgi:hypothetical protein